MDASEIEQRMAVMAERARARRTEAPPEPEPEPTPTPPATRNVVPFRPRRDASVPRLDRIADTEARELPGFPNAAGNAPTEPTQLDLPGLGPVISGCPSWLLWMYDRAGGDSLAQGRGAPWPMRLFVGALLHLPITDRDGEWRTIRIPTAEVISWLHPRGWTNRRRDWDRFPGALDAMRERLAYVPVPGIGSVALMFPSVIPRATTDPFVEFTIRIPTAAARGASIDWLRLCVYGTQSAALYRAYLSVSAYLDRSAHRGHPITAQIGVPKLGKDGQPRRRKGGALVRSRTEIIANSAARYVQPLTDPDLARMIGLDPQVRQYRAKARHAIEQLAADRVIEIHRDRDGVRLFGPPPARPVSCDDAASSDEQRTGSGAATRGRS